MAQEVPVAEPTPTDPNGSRPGTLTDYSNRKRPVGVLPATLTSFIGREREVAAVVKLLRQDEVRLVTLTGPGGVGKTRLALRVAEALALDFTDGVVFVSLAPVSDPNLVTPTLAQVLGIREVGDQPLDKRLAEALRDHELLFVLDNFEHILEAAAQIATVLTHCPRVKECP